MKKISIDSIRNLPQYSGLSDEELQEVYDAIIARRNQQSEDELQKELLPIRVERKLKELAEDYDLDDLKYNDKMQLEDLAVAMVTLEDLQIKMYELQVDVIDNSNISVTDRLSRIISNLRSDISKIQDDLKMSRKIRKSDKEESVAKYISDLRRKAKARYEETLTYIYCPKCKMLICNAWFLYPNEDNSITLTCNRNNGDEDDPDICGHTFTITSKELMKHRGHSKEGVYPNE